MIETNNTYYISAYRHSADRMQGDPLGNGLEKIEYLVARFSKIAEPFIRNYIKECHKDLFRLAHSRGSPEVLYDLNQTQRLWFQDFFRMLMLRCSSSLQKSRNVPV